MLNLKIIKGRGDDVFITHFPSLPRLLDSRLLLATPPLTLWRRLGALRMCLHWTPVCAPRLAPLLAHLVGAPRRHMRRLRHWWKLQALHGVVRTPQ